MLVWVLFSVIAAGLVGGAALAAEKAVRLAGLPARYVWVFSMVAAAGPKDPLLR